MSDELVLRLAQPSAALLPAFLELAAEFVAEGDERYRAALDAPEAYLRRIEQYAAGTSLPPGRVRETTFWAVSGDTVLAFSRLRHQLTETLARKPTPFTGGMKRLNALQCGKRDAILTPSNT